MAWSTSSTRMKTFKNRPIEIKGRSKCFGLFFCKLTVCVHVGRDLDFNEYQRCDGNIARGNAPGKIITTLSTKGAIVI
jgi:hypothetical protein